MSFENIVQKLQKDEVVLLDGGTGTELQKRRLDMVPGAWCGQVSLQNADVLEKVHLDYIEAGADIITANTYASSRIMLREAGYEDQFEEINRVAIETALRAREKVVRKTFCVGSLSHMIQIPEGTDRASKTPPSTDFMEESFEELAMLHKELGCDLILLEMMKHPERINMFMKGALKTGLPLWAGFSFRENESGELCCYDDPSISLQEVLDAMPPKSVDVMGVVHSSANITGRGIGTRILGGYCGLGPEHIEALSELKS